MLSYVFTRLLYAIPILFGVSVVVFALLHLVPGSPLDAMLPPEAPSSLIESMNVYYGFDQPLYIQYFHWLYNIVRGDFGISVFTGMPVQGQILGALGNTLLLAVPAGILALLGGVCLGLVSGSFEGTWIDKAVSVIGISTLSIPQYWLGIVLVVLFSVTLGWLPATGMGEGSGAVSVRNMVLPVITLALVPMGIISRVARASVLDTINQDFVQALQARGLRRRRIVTHVLKNSIPPTLAVAGLQFGYLLGGSILVETVFNWPGSGQLMNLAIFRRDIPVLQATVLIIAAIFVLINIVVDIIQVAVDPRIRR